MLDLIDDLGDFTRLPLEQPTIGKDYVPIYDQPIVALDEPILVSDPPAPTFEPPQTIFDEPVLVSDPPAPTFEPPQTIFDEPILSDELVLTTDDAPPAPTFEPPEILILADNVEPAFEPPQLTPTVDPVFATDDTAPIRIPIRTPKYYTDIVLDDIVDAQPTYSTPAPITPDIVTVNVMQEPITDDIALTPTHDGGLLDQILEQQEQQQIACTMDAKICPDGVTAVGRVAPNCEFAPCPVVSDSDNEATVPPIQTDLSAHPFVQWLKEHKGIALVGAGLILLLIFSGGGSRVVRVIRES